MKKLFALLFLPLVSLGQPGPEVTSWIINTTGQTGYNGILTNVQQVQYSTNNVYVTATCIPDYSIGPWTANPNTPVNQNFVFKITRNPQQNTGTLVATPMGHIGVWTNGVSIFNAKDGMSYNNQGIWNRDARYWEGISFDNCLGHPAPNGEYHLHVNPTCLYDDTDSTLHAPIIGYAFDGFPIYGAYGYSNTNGTGPFRTILTSYRLRNITQRTTLPNGTVLNTNQYGPAIGGQYPLGAFLEDYEYVAGLGDLDEHNGRFCVTPEYPNGIYAYFVTLDFNQDPVFPYTLGPYYYGTVQPGNTGPNSGHNTISEPVTVYVPGATALEEETSFTTSVFPNPAKDAITFSRKDASQKATVILSNIHGATVMQRTFEEGMHTLDADISSLAKGTYVIKMSDGTVTRIVVM